MEQRATTCNSTARYGRAFVIKCSTGGLLGVYLSPAVVVLALSLGFSLSKHTNRLIGVDVVGAARSPSCAVI